MAWISRPTIAALGDDFELPRIPGGKMKCPFCTEHTPDAWDQIGFIHGSGKDFTNLVVEWMRCANPACQQATVKATERHVRPSLGADALTSVSEDMWLVRPMHATRHVAAIVPEKYKSMYVEATAILDTSPRMSAVLSRRILGDLLEDYVKLDQFSLAARIDKFVADETQPGYIRENLHHLREVADFGAHTQKDDQAEIIDVGREEAEWTLDIIDGLFDHFIINPERNKRMREGMDEKIKAAGRKSLEPPEEGATL